MIELCAVGRAGPSPQAEAGLDKHRDGAGRDRERAGAALELMSPLASYTSWVAEKNGGSMVFLQAVPS
jgi:hypothetical protein